MIRRHPTSLPSGKAYACDSCRKRKIKCNRYARAQEAESFLDSAFDAGGSVLDVPCSSCMTSGAKCTYGTYSQPKISHPKAYVEHLESRVAKLSVLLRRVWRSCPSADLRKEIDCLLSVTPAQGGKGRKSWRTRDALGPSLLTNDIPSSQIDLLPGRDISEPSQQKCVPPYPSVDVRMRGTQLTAVVTNKSKLKESHLRGGVEDTGSRFFTLHKGNFLLSERFNGESSVLSLICTTLPLKGNTEISHLYGPPAPNELCVRSPGAKKNPPLGFINTSAVPNDPPGPEFPPRDLLMTLVELYLSRVNIIWPLLHGPTFKADIARQRHLQSLDFGNVVLAVCAVASRYCKDPRVLAKVRRQPFHLTSLPSLHSWDSPLPWVDDQEQPCTPETSIFEEAPLCSAGWKYYSRIRQLQSSIVAPVKLTELQTVFLTNKFLIGMPDLSAGWVSVGAAIRRAQDRGVHREKMYGSPELETELWKRAFWCLVVADRMGSARFRRSCCSNHEDADVELPLEIDDEFWSSPDKNGSCVPLQQPTEKPSILVAFNAQIKLSSIYFLMLKSMYILDGSKSRAGISTQANTQQTVSRLNDALEEWLASLPSHLTWNPSEPNPVWRTQSTNLYIVFHLLRIQIYRDFLPTVKYPQALRPYVSHPFPALAICAHAARSIASLLKEELSHVSRDGDDDDGCLQLNDVPTLMIGAFMTAFMLLTTKVEERCSGTSDSTVEGNNDELLEVFLRTLMITQLRWPKSARGLEILRSIVSAPAIETKNNAVPLHGHVEPYKVSPSCSLSLGTATHTRRYLPGLSYSRTIAQPSDEYSPGPDNMRPGDKLSRYAASRASTNPTQPHYSDFPDVQYIVGPFPQYQVDGGLKNAQTSDNIPEPLLPYSDSRQGYT